MALLVELLKSGTFWTAFGSIATAVGAFYVIFKDIKARPQPPKPPGPGPGRLTNREKIRSCLANHPGGATLQRIADETGIPIGSLSSDMAGREAMGVEKQGYGQTAIYRLKQGVPR